jgi:hypothetical protein
LTATWHATCQVWRSATLSLWRAPCVAAVAMAPLALILVVRLPSAAMSSISLLRRYYGEREGPFGLRRLPCFGREERAAVTRICVEPGVLRCRVRSWAPST